MTAVISMVLAIVLIISMTTAGVIYAKDTSTAQATNYINTTKLPKKLNAIIIDAINAEVRSVYGDD